MQVKEYITQANRTDKKVEGENEFMKAKKAMQISSDKKNNGRKDKDKEKKKKGKKKQKEKEWLPAEKLH